MKPRLDVCSFLKVASRVLQSIPIVLLLFGSLDSGPAVAQHNHARFASPEEATRALILAARVDDTKALLRVLGPDSRAIVLSGDPVSDRQARERLVQEHDEARELVRAGETEISLQLGKDRWPFPIPLVKDAQGWRFDTAKGKEEILRRRIGRKLDTIQVCLAYVDAQREYAQKDRDGGLSYAQKVASDPGKRNGLYWEAKPGEEPSPLGPLVAAARGEGYPAGKSTEPVPFHGYYFRILTGQGKHAPGGAYSYVAKGKMIGGFGPVAFPAQYGASGVMTFIVNHDGTVFQKDLGPNTTAVARRMTAFDPDESWKAAQ